MKSLSDIAKDGVSAFHGGILAVSTDSGSTFGPSAVTTDTDVWVGAEQTKTAEQSAATVATLFVTAAVAAARGGQSAGANMTCWVRTYDGSSWGAWTALDAQSVYTYAGGVGNTQINGVVSWRHKLDLAGKTKWQAKLTGYNIVATGSPTFTASSLSAVHMEVAPSPVSGPVGILDLTDSAPSAPDAGKVRLFRRPIAARNFLGTIGSSGLDTSLQPSLFRNKVGLWIPPGNATTVPGVFGFPAATATGTATARNVATTNLFTRLRRLGYVSAGTAGSLAGARFATAQFTVGDGAGLGGFFLCTRFGCSDAATVAGARQFVGMRNSTSAPTNVEPSTLTNSIGVGHGAADTNLKIFYGGSAAQTPIDLGANFPANTLSVDAYELALFAPPSSNNTVYYEVTRLNTGHVASGTLTGTAGTALPSSTTLLCFNSFRTNNATALAVGIDFASIYLETDY